MERVGGIGERGGAIAPGFGDMRVWVKHDLRTSPRGPSHRLWIAPAFVADRHTEGQRPGREDPTFAPERRIDGLFPRVDLSLVLPPRNRAVGIDHAGGDLQAAVGHALGAQDDRDAGGSGGIGHSSPGPFEEHRIGRWRGRARPPVPGNEAFGKADHHRASTACVRDCRCRQTDRVVRSRGHAEVRKRDADGAHFDLESSSSMTPANTSYGCAPERARPLM